MKKRDSPAISSREPSLFCFSSVFLHFVLQFAGGSITPVPAGCAVNSAYFAVRMAFSE